MLTVAGMLLLVIAGAFWFSPDESVVSAIHGAAFFVSGILFIVGGEICGTIRTFKK